MPLSASERVRTKRRRHITLVVRHPLGVPTPFTCPVCGFEPLTARPYADYIGVVPDDATPPYEEYLGRSSYEVCPTCGFEFGNDDNPGTAAPASFSQYRAEWLARGGKWFDSSHTRGHGPDDPSRPVAFRLRVKDTFTLTGRGSAVVGYIEHGEVNVGDALVVERTGSRAVVRDVGGVREASWRPGDAAPIGLVLPGLDLATVQKGDFLVAAADGE